MKVRVMPSRGHEHIFEASGADIFGMDMGVAAAEKSTGKVGT